MVPLAFIEKKPMRHFDATLSDGTAVPILGSGEVREVMTSTLVLLLTKNGVEQTQALSKAMLELVSSSGADNRSKVECLLETGKWKGVPLWDPKKLKNQNDLGLQELLLNLSTDFLLIGLIPASRAGVRQVLKFSYHWIVDVPNSGFLRRLGLSLLIAFRHSTFEISLRMHMPSAAKSYHLEFHAPPELDIVKLSLPDGEERFDYQGNHSTDIRGLPVAHVYGKFNEAPLEDAKVEVSVPRFKGVWLTAFLASLLTTMVFALALLLPGAMATLERVGGNAATLMLVIPALFLSFLVFSKEHIFVSWILNPLRFVVGVCALMLFVSAGSLVGELNQPFLKWLWCGELFISVLFVLALLSGRISSYSEKFGQTGDAMKN